MNMAKCKKCGRKGLFFKVNSDGMCADCAALTEIEKKKHEMEAWISAEEKKLAEVQNNISLKNEELNRLEVKRQEIYNTIKAQAESIL